MKRWKKLEKATAAIVCVVVAVLMFYLFRCWICDLKFGDDVGPGGFFLTIHHHDGFHFHREDVLKDGQPDIVAIHLWKRQYRWSARRIEGRVGPSSRECAFTLDPDQWATGWTDF